MLFDLNNFEKKITCESACADTEVEAVINGEQLELYVTATNDRVKFVELEWSFKSDENIFVLGDAWERSYGDLEFVKLKDNNRYMPWYFIAADNDKCFCFGVKTRPNAFISFTYGTDGIKALVDCRNGGCGVHLNGRKLCLATFVYKEYDSADVFGCLCDYCKALCVDPILPEERIYGGNNWYYAYGKSSYEEIIRDARVQASLADGIENKPFEVVDDCWEIGSTSGPWLPNEKFRDMKKLADEIREIGARPGIWVRLLNNDDPSITDDMRILRDGKREFLDPTNPEVQQFIKDDILRFKSWGYELMKHDFSTVDLFGDFGNKLTDTITNVDNWHFYDKTKTNAEIVLEFYRLIKETAEGMYIIGCNTVSHLCAGLVHLNRTGDDTSGMYWERTTKMGINTLAFRLAQNEAFYMCDADCVGILDDNIPWEKNKQWLHLLSYSNTPLFISCSDKITEEQMQDISKAYKVFQSEHKIKPVDIFENKTPSEWEIDGETVKYSW